MKLLQTILTGICIFLISGCSTAPTALTSQSAATKDIQAAITIEPSATSAPTETHTTVPITESQLEASAELSPTSTVLPTSTTAPPTARPTLSPGAWMELPVIPDISDYVLQIYQTAIALGNNLHAYSKLGDCGSTPAWFLGDFDRGPDFYRLGEYQFLSKVIHAFKGSHDQVSLAARAGFNASSLMTPLWADRTYCNANETPLACEYRIHKPVMALIMLGTNDIFHPDEFEPQMRKIIEYSIENGVIPILSTKADNEEGDHSINAIIARLAWEYDIPMWNFWLAVQPLPDHGLQEDHVHLTWGRNFFDDPEAMSKAWPVRNLTALQMLDAVWKKVTGQTN